MRVLVASDHPIARQGLAAIVMKSPHTDVVGDSPTWQSLLVMVETAKPDVVLLDVERPNLGWIRAAQNIRSRHPSVLVACLSSVGDEVFMGELSAAGVRTTPIYGRDEAEVQDFIRRCAEQRLAPVGSRGQVHSLRTLTPRELEILQMIVEGSKSLEIGEILGVSVRTVEFHRANILRKTGSRTVADLARLALESGVGTAAQGHQPTS